MGSSCLRPCLCFFFCCFVLFLALDIAIAIFFAFISRNFFL